jgi:hypothetical protein
MPLYVRVLLCAFACLRVLRAEPCSVCSGVYVTLEILTVSSSDLHNNLLSVIPVGSFHGFDLLHSL